MRSLDRSVRERGGALLVALALLALAGALLAGAAQAGRVMARSTQSHGATITVESEARAALAEFVGGWSPGYDSLRIGESSEAIIGPRRIGAAALVAVTRVRLLRISDTRYVVGLETSLGPDGLTSARRRLSLIIERRPATDTLAIRLPPTPIAQWSLADLF
jgi:hypothetical protein